MHYCMENKNKLNRLRGMRVLYREQYAKFAGCGIMKAMSNVSGNVEDRCFFCGRDLHETWEWRGANDQRIHLHTDCLLPVHLTSSPYGPFCHNTGPDVDRFISDGWCIPMAL
jgi:hypothetical protein